MKILPAIDIKEGKCVRLAKGDYSQVTHYFDNPLDVAKKWIDQGSMNLHIVDLDGAKSGKTINYNIIAEIRNSYPDIYIQIGGGIRDIESINKYINIGINKVIVGTRVVSDPSFLKRIPSDIKDKVIIDLAVKDGKLAVHGWNNSSDFTLQDFIKILESDNIQEIVFTDVSKDGMLEGMNFSEISNILSFSSIPLIASGGVTSIDDIKYLCEMNEIKISGVIIGKALYENKINLKDAIKLSNKK
ncbi:1-(5-phosphoribosyl)-5-[(5-phosphoribosylamino)methylideneamino]imidazole-4-carboxamide isomerase [Gammaproteobacteria bacterium]|nr:1-(5-phosphoribosyl)-5-[(5-phosphoribosylamino)methylideneamino]imidazole-4-carboxamide isomerase [Gammaproteobacteria bacterium]